MSNLKFPDRKEMLLRIVCALIFAVSFLTLAHNIQSEGQSEVPISQVVDEEINSATIIVERQSGVSEEILIDPEDIAYATEILERSDAEYYFNIFTSCIVDAALLWLPFHYLYSSLEDEEQPDPSQNGSKKKSA